MDHVQGLLPVNGGMLVTTRRQILLLRDTDGDRVADEREIWFESNDPRHNQLQISSPRFGPDGWIYLNNGLDGKEIYPGDSEKPETNIARRNIRIHPKTRKIETVSGYGQFGATIDPWGRRFSCSNRNPVMFAAMPLHAVERNPHAGLTVGHFDIAPSGGDSLVYPFNVSHTTAAAHLGTHTAACGLCWYGGDIFVCEPTAQLVTRNRIGPDGASLKATRVRTKPQAEFLRSRDVWFRPVNLRVGPDGALYVCDMYRRFIDHARFFPEEFQQAHYMRAGFDQGRIWRLQPKNFVPPMDRRDSASLPTDQVKDIWARPQDVLMSLKFEESPETWKTPSNWPKPAARATGTAAETSRPNTARKRAGAIFRAHCGGRFQPTRGDCRDENGPRGETTSTRSCARRS